MDLQINEKLVKYNFSSRDGEKIKYIVIHDTDNKSKGADANAHFEFFNSGDRQSSAHYFVDDTQILRIIKDENKSWGIGDGAGKYGITNANSINVEMCVNVDGDFEKMYFNTLKLTKFLIEKHEIDFENVVRHYDASKKICPDSFKKNNWEKWNEFKNDLNEMINNKKDYRKIIERIYENIFEREPDYDGLNFWNDKLQHGLSYGDMLKSFGDSEEFLEKYVD